jgi:hypothetical protein
MKAISKQPLNLNFPIPIRTRDLSRVMGFRIDELPGEVAILRARWNSCHDSSRAYVSPCNQVIAWPCNGIWYLARRHKNYNIDATEQRCLGWDLFGIGPCIEFVLPSTIVVPVLGPHESTTGVDVRCQRIHPPADAAPRTANVLGYDVEFRICRSERNGTSQRYAELNFGPPRKTALGQPRRATYLTDCRHYLRDVSVHKHVAGQAIMRLLTFIHASGYALDDQANRPDLLRIGEYNMLPNSQRPYALLNWPGTVTTTLLAFPGLPCVRRVVPPETVESIVAEVDASLVNGVLIRRVRSGVWQKLRHSG